MLSVSRANEPHQLRRGADRRYYQNVWQLQQDSSKGDRPPALATTVVNPRTDSPEARVVDAKPWASKGTTSKTLKCQLTSSYWLIMEERIMLALLDGEVLIAYDKNAYHTYGGAPTSIEEVSVFFNLIFNSKLIC